MSREDQYNVTVSVAGRPLGTWDTTAGGEVDSDETKYRPGAMGPQKSLGGFKIVNNVTVTREFDLSRDPPLLPFLLSQVGKGEVVVNKQPLDVDGNVFGGAIVYTGRLKQVTLPDHDSNSSDVGKVELEVSSAQAVAT